MKTISWNLETLERLLWHLEHSWSGRFMLRMLHPHTDVSSLFFKWFLRVMICSLYGIKKNNCTFTVKKKKQPGAWNIGTADAWESAHTNTITWLFIGRGDREPRDPHIIASYKPLLNVSYICRVSALLCFQLKPQFLYPLLGGQLQRALKAWPWLLIESGRTVKVSASLYSTFYAGHIKCGK